MAIKTIKEESLTALGNAIRNKTGNENLLEFPNGMVNAISGIETSGAIEALDITANGVYNAPEGVDGYNPITVNVPQKEPNIQNLSISANGTYTAPSGTDGYSPVVVDVPLEGPDVSNITIKTDPSGLFSKEKWNELMPYFRNITINSTSSWSLDELFYSNYNYTDLSHITFKMNCNMYYFSGLKSLFGDCSRLTALPNFDWSSTSVGAPSNFFWVNSMFHGSNNLRTISDTFFSDIPFAADSYEMKIIGSNMFSSCYSLRQLPDLSCFDGKNTQFSGSSIYQTMFLNCYSLDKIVDLPILKVSNPTRNGFIQIFDNCFRLKEMTFKTGIDSAPRTDSGWTSQAIDLSYYVGYAQNNQIILGYNSGITADKEVTDDTSYQALKNDPDWFTCNVAYSRYNHDSAVETINSLPDCSSAGTNTIKFLGIAGSATDGGAINTLTEEEIAVATAKGWTVSLS